MDRRAWSLLLFLGALWGASYLFIKIALDDLSPAMVVFVRTALGALVLAPVAARRGGLSRLAGVAPPAVAPAAGQGGGPVLLPSGGVGGGAGPPARVPGGSRAQCH